METILFLTHTEADGSLSKAARETLAAAIALGMNLHGELPGASLTVGLLAADDAADNAQSAADSIGGCGAARFLAVTGGDFATARYATDAAAAEALTQAAGATLVVAPGTSRWARCLAGVAQRMHGRADTHATAVTVEAGAPTVTRWYYRQRIEGASQRAQRAWFIPIWSAAHTWPRESARDRRPRGSRCSQGDSLVLPPEDRGRVAARAAAVVHPAGAGIGGALARRPRARRAGACASRGGRAPAPHGILRLACAAHGSANHSSGGRSAASGRRGMDEETVRRPDTSGGCRAADPGLPAACASLAGRQQVAGGPERRRAGGAALHDASEPSRADGIDAAASEGAGHLLPWRRTARRGLAVHQRAASNQPGPELRLGARQSRRSVRRRRLRRDGAVEPYINHQAGRQAADRGSLRRQLLTASASDCCTTANLAAYWGLQTG